MGQRLAMRFVVVLLGLQRLSFLVPIAVGHADAGTIQAGAVILGVTLGWNVGIFLHAYRRGWFPEGVVWTDVLWTMALAFAGPAGVSLGAADGPLGWATLAAQASAALAAAILPALRAGVAVFFLLGTHGFATSLEVAPSVPLLPDLFTTLSAIPLYALVIGFVSKGMLRSGRRLDHAVAQRLGDGSAHTADRARLAHHRALHETVLATLTAVAQGSGDAGEQTRERAAHESGYLQRLLRPDDDGERAPLREPLAQVIWEVETLGLHVHYVHDMVPDSLPPEVVDTLQAATREALYNVLHHAHTDTVWLTAITDTESAVIRIVDAGRGFDTSTAPTGRGLRTHVIGPMAAIGGFGRISSAAGEGTCVELSWTR